MRLRHGLGLGIGTGVISRLGSSGDGGSPDGSTFQITAADTFGGFGLGYANDLIEPGGPFTGGTISPDPPKLAGVYQVRRCMDTEDPAFSIVLEYRVEGETPAPDALFTAVRVQGLDDAIDATMLTASAEFYSHSYNGVYTAWAWNGGLGLVSGNRYIVTFTLAE